MAQEVLVDVEDGLHPVAALDHLRRSPPVVEAHEAHAPLDVETRLLQTGGALLHRLAGADRVVNHHHRLRRVEDAFDELQ
ncbi:MAG: hypothetical protein LC733_09725 [Actinobacteria bacterium]|nr:hypothetical protein [Actinomycetota bacterium]